MTEIKKTSSAIEKVHEPIIAENEQTVNANALISQAIVNNVPVETLERLLAMKEKIDAENARRAFNRAMAKFQSECPTITKTKEVKTKTGIVAYRYAPIESIVEQVKPYLESNGFSYSTNMEVLPAGVKVSCKVVHVEGHSETSEMEVPLGSKTEIMSASQVTAAASTFAKRYAFCNAFGILTGDEDNDGQTDRVEQPKKLQATPVHVNETKDFPPSKAQLTVIKKVMTEKGITKEDIIDAGFVGDAMKLTGGREGTASELIQWLFDHKGKIVNGQVIEELPTIHVVEEVFEKHKELESIGDSI